MLRPVKRLLAPLRATGPAKDSIYIAAVIDKAEQALDANLNAAKKAKFKAETYYNRPHFDRFTGMWDYDADEKAELRRIEQIEETCKMRRLMILKRFEDIINYHRNNYGTGAVPTPTTGECTL